MYCSSLQKGRKSGATVASPPSGCPDIDPRRKAHDRSLSPHVVLGGMQKPGSFSSNPIHKVTLNGFHFWDISPDRQTPRSLRFGEALGNRHQEHSTDGSTIKIYQKAWRGRIHTSLERCSESRRSMCTPGWFTGLKRSRHDGKGGVRKSDDSC